MESLYLLIPISTVLVFLAIWVFVRASDSGQFDDMVGPALRILLDDDSAHQQEKIIPEPLPDNDVAK
ncbi:cytochrome oxidase maturation protein, cbb3-type [Collimonas arenae]|uniref:Cytochrome oxidase maturation protein, cbb3-type n=1 Tax=Collimonas arenae TaxID=279058 RepID=A0A127PQL7_9BURK|nr:cbb3-type cytochrome oxidase assembly protein CcoS [Collimonas arenae]AMP00100.1 cytochrome oxidase maturation protein, cbb3-type [Collimonas arenae]AMP09998.1 cytochrome oxidase maturation protein, cbb3-type [Collimonas arenae]